MSEEVPVYIGIDELEKPFTDPLKYVSPLLIAENIYFFADKIPHTDPVLERRIRTKPVFARVGEVLFQLSLEKPTPHANHILLTGLTITPEEQRLIYFDIQKNQVLDKNSDPISSRQERKLVELLDEFFTAQGRHPDVEHD